MIEYILMGTKKHGCLIDNRKKEIIYYQLLSLYEKIVKEPQQLLIKYSDIKKIKIYCMAIGADSDLFSLKSVSTYPIVFNSVDIINVISKVCGHLND